MKRVFDEVYQRANVLEDHLEKYFPASLAQQSFRLIQQSFTQCGQCRQMCQLKQSGGQMTQKCIYCTTCEKSLPLPISRNADYKPFDHICPICSYQVITAFNSEKNSSHHFCPYCFNYPPQHDIEDAAQVLNGMRCFQCSRQDCALSNKSVETPSITQYATVEHVNLLNRIDS